MRKLREQEPDGFAEFWDCWRPHMRHTDGRGDARKAFRKHVLEGADPQDIIDGARAYIRNHLSLPPEKQAFIPLAASWINKEAYMDWCEKERAYQARIQERRQQSNVVQIAPRPVKKTAFLELWERQKSESA